MSYGYAEKLLFLDLSTQKVETKPSDGQLLRNYISKKALLTEQTHPEPGFWKKPTAELSKRDIPLPEALNRFEKYYIERCLETCRGNRFDSASELGISHKTLQEK